MEKNVVLEVLDPMGDVVVGVRVPLAARLKTLESKTIGLVWNGKKHADKLLDSVERLLSDRFPAAKINRYITSSVSNLPKSGELEKVAQEVDAVVYASGD
jgi:hypothetical protein